MNEKKKCHRPIQTGVPPAAGLLLAAAMLAPGAGARADEILYDEEGTKVSASFTGVVGVFGVGNADFGAGDFNTPNNSSVRNTERVWVETSIKPALAAETPLWDYGTGYSLFSFVAQGTRGNGDAVSSLPQYALRSTTGNQPTHIQLEDGMVGWRSGDTFKDALGTDAVDVSYGNQSFLVGDGLVIGSGIFNAFGRGAFYTSLNNDFGRTAIVKLNPDGVPVRANFFKLEDRVDQDLLQDSDQPKAKLAGFNAEWYRAGEKKEGDEAPPPDVWTLGLLYFNIYDADSTSSASPTGAFSFTPTSTAASLAEGANRNGLNVYSFRAAGSFFEFDRDIMFYGEYVGQQNGNTDRRVDAHAWYVEPGYKFSDVDWTPQVAFRYAQFSGESDPNGHVKHSYDSLFYTAGPRGYGSWYLGEIYGWYLGTPSNIDVVMASVTVSPLDTLNAGVIFYDFRFDQTAQFNNPSITNDHALDEVDVYAIWSPEKWLSISSVLGFGVPGEGFKQAAASFVAANGPPGRTVGNTIVLGEIVATVKF
ncbi:MAG TPA: alginate export family protein [Alphaproteobacteria bacterium]|nr:alginate export family protein [Alphaproteobacteria bacterium]